MNTVSRQLARLQPDEPSQAASMLCPIRSRGEINAADERCVHGPAQPAAVQERRHLDAVDIDARVARSRAPHNELSVIERRARDTREALNGLRSVAHRACDAPPF